MSRIIGWAALGLVVFPLTACGDDAADDGAGGAGGEHAHGEDVDAEACEHFADGPFNDVTASADTAAAPDVGAEHTAHRITLVDDGGQSGGFVRFEAGEATDFVFFLDGDVPLAITDGSGAAVALEESCDPAACSDACAAIAGRHVVPLAVGTYFLELGPTPATEVALVHEELAHEE